MSFSSLHSLIGYASLDSIMNVYLGLKAEFELMFANFIYYITRIDFKRAYLEKKIFNS